MRLTPAQVAFRMYIGMGIPFENMSTEEQRKLGIEWLNSSLKTETWPRDEFDLYDFLVLENPGHFTYQNDHFYIKEWLDGKLTRTSRKYILVEFGAPQVSKDLPFFRPNCLAVMARTWEHVHVFNSTSHYTASPREIPSLGLITRVLAHTLYNPQMNLEFNWRRQSGTTRGILFLWSKRVWSGTMTSSNNGLVGTRCSNSCVRPRPGRTHRSRSMPSAAHMKSNPTFGITLTRCWEKQIAEARETRSLFLSYPNAARRT